MVRVFYSFIKFIFLVLLAYLAIGGECDNIKLSAQVGSCVKERKDSADARLN